MIRDKPRIKTDRAIQGRVSTRTIEAAWLESLRRLASMYPETASFPVQERRHSRSRNSTCEADNRGLCGPGTRIGNRGCFRGDAFFRLRREDHGVGYENLVAWVRWLGFERLVSCCQTWTFRGVLPVKISFLPYDVDAAFGRWR